MEVVNEYEEKIVLVTGGAKLFFYKKKHLLRVIYEMF